MEIGTLHIAATPESIAELDRLGDEIAGLSAHLEAATAHLLELSREFDARGGWNHGFRSCAHWLSWRRVDRLAEARETTRRHERRALHVYQDEDGMQALAAAPETLYRRARTTDAAKSAEDVPAGTSSVEAAGE